MLFSDVWSENATLLFKKLWKFIQIQQYYIIALITRVFSAKNWSFEGQRRLKVGRKDETIMPSNCLHWSREIDQTLIAGASW